MPILSRYHSQVHAMTRMVLGFLFACHGARKLLGLFGGIPAEHLNALTYTAGAIELVGGFLILIGLQTSWSAFICSGTMAVAYFMAHQSQGILPIQNQGEPAAMYCWIFLLLATMGDGIWSVGKKKE